MVQWSEMNEAWFVFVSNIRGNMGLDLVVATQNIGDWNSQTFSLFIAIEN